MSLTKASATPLAIFILADTSGSMAQDGKLFALNKGIVDLIESLSELNAMIPVVLSVISFGGDKAVLHLPPSPVGEIAEWKMLSCGGKTPMGDALSLLSQLAEDQFETMQAHMSAVIVLVSDGRPTDEYRGALANFNQSRLGKNSHRFALQIGLDADAGILRRFVEPAQTSTHTCGAIFRSGSADRISEFFEVISKSVEPRLVAAEVT